jgi:hypothetical protein
MKIRLVEAELFHMDGQTDRHDESSGSFRKSADVPNNNKTTTIKIYF